LTLSSPNMTLSLLVYGSADWYRTLPLSSVSMKKQLPP